MRIGCPLMVIAAAKIRQPPAAVIEPVLMPMTPAVPRSRLTLRTVPTTGSFVVGILTMAAKVGMVIAVSASLSWSSTVLTVAGSQPDGSV